MANHLTGQTSPYLIQHAENPVDWYPWGEEAFARARAEDKPVFLSIGYSTCHWCHVMAHESFEDGEIAAILNRGFVAVKVDKEERPDVDSVYMAVCQAFTGSGGWPTSIFMTAEKEPFFAGTYFPKSGRGGAPGLKQILLSVRKLWETDREALLRSADGVLEALRREPAPAAPADETLLRRAMDWYGRNYDGRFGGFGDAPKFPAPHNLLFLLQQYARHGDREALDMAETTLLRMYQGGLFDHIGGGFCRYSTDRSFLAPHFEKMLYDNALLILAYSRAYELTRKPLYLRVAESAAGYVLRELGAPDGGFFSAQDADSGGQEGAYYLLTPEETVRVLGEEEGAAFNACFDITPGGNFEGKSIPNLLRSQGDARPFDGALPKLREYRRQRAVLHTDDKRLCFWNALAIAALAALYRVSGREGWLEAALGARRFLEQRLCEGDTLYVSFRDGRRGERGFLDDYAGYAFALLALYDATLDRAYLARAEQMAERAEEEFLDAERGGYFLYGRDSEALPLRPKESYDGALPSGNSLMAYVLVRLAALVPGERWERRRQRQLDFLAGQAAAYPAGYSLFLTALSEFLEPPPQIVAAAGAEERAGLPLRIPLDSLLRTAGEAEAGYERRDGRAAFYVCQNRACLPPMSREELEAHFRGE